MKDATSERHEEHSPGTARGWSRGSCRSWYVAAGRGTHPVPQLSAAGEIRGVVAGEPQVSPGPYAAADVAFGLDVLGAWCRQDPARSSWPESPTRTNRSRTRLI